MTATTSLFLLWLSGRPRWQRYMVHAVWASQLAGIALFLFAPKAAAEATQGLMAFAGIKDSHGVPLPSNMFVRADDSLFDWNGVLPRVRSGASISAGIGNAVGALETSVIVVIASFLLWLMRALRSLVWNDLFGAVFSTVGFSLDKALDSAPFLAIGIITGTLVGILIGVAGHYTAGRMTIAATWFLGIFGLTFGKGLLGEMLAPVGWIDNVRSVGSGIAGVLMSQGRSLSSGSTAIDARIDELEVGFADAIRHSLQQWMLGQVVDDTSPSCAAAWDAGQMSGNPTKLSEYITTVPSDGGAPACPQAVIDHIGNAGLFDGVVLIVLVLACLGVGAWFAWCGLNCLFRAMFMAALAVGFIIYGLFPGFPRRFLKLASFDFVAQLLSYGWYMVLTGLYVLVLMVAWKAPMGPIPEALQGGEGVEIGDNVRENATEGGFARLLVTAIVMVMFFTTLRHLGRLHRQAMQTPSAPNVSPRSLAAPAAIGAAAGLSAMSAANGGRGPAGGGAGGNRPTNNRSTASRINAGLQAAQMALSRSHPAAAAVGAVAGGFGSAGFSAVTRHGGGAGSRGRGLDGSAAAGGRPGSRGPAGQAGTAPSSRQQAQQRAAAVRADAARIARESALKRPETGGRGGSRPAGGNSSGFQP
ncbi:hypothetical protein KL864_16775 [Mycolicibacterium goodii]|uniref:hypothetical protein n=1 Tax=Mycolicibacterium goodii TaxID=134601 RepID=UPI001BDC4E40|nr:hypothetical protein [Mycolicibacterium goodii]MBU8817557.1 hypothetical protein [Mycolicibacterium goodii]